MHSTESKYNERCEGKAEREEEEMLVISALKTLSAQAAYLKPSSRVSFKRWLYIFYYMSITSKAKEFFFCHYTVCLRPKQRKKLKHTVC